jgi:DNA-binding HxlR family transcriptional regulator
MKPSHLEVTPACRADLGALPVEMCQSVGEVLARVGDKWSILTIYLLSKGSLRFSELKRRIPTISQKVLTSILRGLERDGYVLRTVTVSIPPRVDYALTMQGMSVLKPVTNLAMWAMEHHGQVTRARVSFDSRDG